MRNMLMFTVGVVALYHIAFAQGLSGGQGSSGSFSAGTNTTSSATFKPQQPNFQNFAPDFNRNTNVYDAQGQPVGYAAPKIGGGESVFDSYGNPQGYVSQTGAMYDEKGKFIGYTTSSAGFTDQYSFDVVGDNATNKTK